MQLSCDRRHVRFSRFGMGSIQVVNRSKIVQSILHSSGIEELHYNTIPGILSIKVLYEAKAHPRKPYIILEN